MAEKQKKRNNGDQKLVSIVGIGASAGGLQALKDFFAHVPAKTGLAYVVVVHLSPKHKSVLAELLQPHVSMPVQQVTRTLVLKPNHVYIIPPNANLNSIDTHLRLSDLEQSISERAPIDHFFRTLAKTHNGNAIGIILTGTGSDGTLGLKEIKEKGGLILVQDPKESEYSGMPQSAIATGLIDMILPVKEMPDYFIRFANTNPKIRSLEPGKEPASEELQMLNRVFAQVRARTGRDFTHYKVSTILRRIQRRMQLYQIEDMEVYLDMLRKNPEEVRSLADDFLINVTNFFRDEKVFIHLRQNVIPAIFDAKEPDDTIRVWSVGCATGEEAYSLGILLMEEARHRQISPSIQIFASDLHEISLKKGREGFYPGDIRSEISQNYLNRYFTRKEGGYRVRKELREKVIFTSHNLLGDPPFSHIDLLVCRNLLIYLKREIQQNVIELFHYSIHNNGFLVLGTSENLEKSELFSVSNKDHSVYIKRNVTGPEPRLPVFPRVTAQRREVNGTDQQETLLQPGVLHQKMVERFAPPSILLSADFQVLHISNHAGRYLSLPGGEPSRDIFKLILPELQMELRSVLYTAKERGTLVRSQPLLLPGKKINHNLIILATSNLDPEASDAILVMFEEFEGTVVLPAEPGSKEGNKEGMKLMEEQVQEYREQLQAVIEEYETSQEEMKASNEELQSANEELRSTLEELETSKEELQSVNEELITVNQENRHKVEELAQLSDDLQNLLAATDIATLFLDREFRILRFTPKLGELFNVRLADRGRPISDQTHKLGYESLIGDAKNVLKTLQPMEREVSGENGHTFLVRLLPYRSAEDKIEGVVITFIDITSQKVMMKDLEKARDYAEAIIETLHEPLMILSPDLRIISANKAFYRSFKLEPEEILDRSVYEPGNGMWDFKDFRKLMADVQKNKRVYVDTELEHEFHQTGIRVILLSAIPLDHPKLILIGIRDITRTREAEDIMKQSKARLQKMVNVEGVGVLIFSLEGKVIDANETFLGMTGISQKDIKSGKLSWKDFGPLKEPGSDKLADEPSENTVRIVPYEREISHKNGSTSWMLFAGANLGDGTIILYCIDISDRKKAQLAVKESEERFDAISDLVPDLLWSNDNAARTDWINRQLEEYTGLSLEEIRGKGWQQILHPDDRDETIGKLNRSIRQAKTIRSEIRLRRKDGAYRWFLVRLNPAKGTAGNVIKWYGAATDVHKERSALDALQVAKERAEDAARAKEEFLAHMSHEIRTPLNAILGLSYLMLKQHPRKDQMEYLTSLRESAESLHILINDILDLSKVRAGRMPVTNNNVSLNDLIKRVLNTHRPATRQKEIELRTKISGDLPERIVTDELKLYQILNNLLSNAAKFTHEGFVELSVSLNRRKGERVWLDFSVRDTGIGIPKDKKEEIFDEFSRGNNSISMNYEGTGLGLTLCRLYLDMLGAVLKVESEVEKGSRFFFTLPALVGDETNAKKMDREPNRSRQIKKTVYSPC